MKKLIVATAAVALCLAGCTSSPEVTESVPDKYEQTWPYSYSETTCAEWSSEMDNHQQFVAAADMLLGARSVDGSEDMVSDGMIDDFSAGVSNVCIEPSMSIADVAVGLYLTEPQFQP